MTCKLSLGWSRVCWLALVSGVCFLTGIKGQAANSQSVMYWPNTEAQLIEYRYRSVAGGAWSTWRSHYGGSYPGTFCGVSRTWWRNICEFDVYEFQCRENGVEGPVIGKTCQSTPPVWVGYFAVHSGGFVQPPWKISKEVCNESPYRQTLVWQFGDGIGGGSVSLAPGECYTVNREVANGEPKPWLELSLAGFVGDSGRMEDAVVNLHEVYEGWEQTDGTPSTSTSTSTGYQGEPLPTVTGTTASNQEADNRNAATIRDAVTDGLRNVLNSLGGKLSELGAKIDAGFDALGDAIQDWKDDFASVGFPAWRQENAAGFNANSNKLDRVWERDEANKALATTAASAEVINPLLDGRQAASIEASEGISESLRSGGGLSTSLADLGAALPDGSGVGDLDLSISIPGAGGGASLMDGGGSGFTIDLNPAHNPMIHALVVSLRSLMAWAVFALFAWKNLGVIREVMHNTALFNTDAPPPETHVEIPMLGSVAGRLFVSLRGAVLFGFVVVGLGALLAMVTTGGLFGGLAVPFGVSSGALWDSLVLVAYMIPLATIISQAVLHVVVRCYADAMVITFSGLVRFMS